MPKKLHKINLAKKHIMGEEDLMRLHASPPPQLLAIDGFGERKIQFSSGMCALRGYPCSRRWFHTHAHSYRQHEVNSVGLRKKFGCGYLLPSVAG